MAPRAQKNTAAAARSRSRPAARTSAEHTTNARSGAARSRSRPALSARRAFVETPIPPSARGAVAELLSPAERVKVAQGRTVAEFLYRPHTISVLLAILGTFAYVALWCTHPADTKSNVLRGLGAAAAVFVMLGMTQLRDGPFIRPHPVVWRAVQAVSIVYLAALVFLFFQTATDARRLVSFLDPALGRPLPERSYAEDCSLTWEAILPQLDIFVVAHLVGWYVKALIVRDTWLCWIMSVGFEVLEYSLQHQLPNFAECWWDHWILDVFTCNWAGIWLGMLTCRYLAMKTYAWRTLPEISSVRGKVGRTFAQFTPHSWVAFEWGASRTLRGYLVAVLVTAMMLLAELNAFYLKYLLWIPPPHWINVSRLALYVPMGAAALRETYQYFSVDSPHAAETGIPARLGAQAWICCAIIVIETLICVKFGRGEFPAPWPRAVLVFWGIFLTLLVAFPVVRFGLRPRMRGHAKRT